MRTTVKNWFADKGYGFLNNGQGDAPDIIVHSSELKNCTYLKPGRTVEFACHFNNKGLVAKNVVLVHENTTPGNDFARPGPRVVAVNGWNQTARPRYPR